jgi:hypothetical protein
MSISEKLQVIAENQQLVYQAGYDKGVAEGGGVVGDDYVVSIPAPPNTIKTYTDNVSCIIPDNQCKDCKELTSVAAPFVLSVGNHAFDGCSKLTTVDFNTFYGGFDSRWIECIGEFAFASCVSLRNIMIYVCEDDSDPTTGILRYAFSGCTNLEKVDLLATASIIREGTFLGCDSLRTLILRYETFESGLELENDNALEGTPIANGNGYIYVPSKCIDGYQSNWSTYANQIRVLEDYTVDGTIDGELDETKI